MELLAGEDLCTMLKTSEQPLSDDQSRQTIGGICAGMHFPHGKETVHGDVKSRNVLLDGAGRAKVCAGCSRVMPLLVGPFLTSKAAPRSGKCELFELVMVTGGLRCRELVVQHE